LGFYGYSPFNQSVKLGRSQQKKLTPALDFKTHLIQIKKIQKGDQVSYGGTFLAPKDMTIGILPAGYNEGIDRGLSNRGLVTIKNIPCQILGRVCMNLTMVDVSNVPGASVGDEVTIYSSNNAHKNTIKKLAKLANTIPYVLLCHLSESAKRTLVE
jgi:alanine racemase